MASNARAIATLRRIIDQFGPEGVVWLDWPMLIMEGTATRVRGELRVDDQISDCDRCGRCGEGSGPVVPRWGGIHSGGRGEHRYAIVHGTPSWEEDQRGEWGAGPAARVLRAELEHQATLNGKFPHTPAATFGTVQCFAPTEGGGKRGHRAATAEEAAACTPHLTGALDAADVRYVLLVGSGAVSAWRSDVLMGDVAGRWGLWRNRWMVYAIPHPLTIMRHDITQGEKREWRDHLARFAQVVGAGGDIAHLSSDCARCRADLYGWDEDGIGWCQEHFNDGAKGAFKNRAQRKRMRVLGQGTLTPTSSPSATITSTPGATA